MKNRRFRLNPATGRRRAVPSVPPSQPHAAVVETTARPTPTDLYSGGYRYDRSTVPGLREHAEDCLSRAVVAEKKANDLLGQAARLRVHAADYFRLAALADLDAETPTSAAWPAPAPQVPAAELVVHFSDRVSFWPPCGARTEATWQTVNPAEVTCPGCQSSMAQAQAQPIGEEPRAAFGPPRTGVNGWGEPAQLPDTLTFAKVEAQR